MIWSTEWRNIAKDGFCAQWIPNTRKHWGKGEWDEEPDVVSWIDSDTSLPCITRRNREGAWCGYVRLEDSPAWIKEAKDFKVHGGVTWTDRWPTEPDGFLIGFDCAHPWDVAPDPAPRRPTTFKFSYRNLAYVIEQTHILALQIFEKIEMR